MRVLDARQFFRLRPAIKPIPSAEDAKGPPDCSGGPFDMACGVAYFR
jgi:hypothetical protein